MTRVLLTVLLLSAADTSFAQELPTPEWYSTEKQLLSKGATPEIDGNGNWFVQRKLLGIDLRYRYFFEDSLLTGVFGFIVDDREVAFESLRNGLVEEYGKPYGYPYKNKRIEPWLIWKLRSSWLVLTHPALVNTTFVNLFPLDTRDREILEFLEEDRR